MKILLKLAVVVVLLVGVAIGAVFFYIDSIARSAVERGGTYALGVPTTLRSADVGVLTGDFALDGLKVENPEGYSSDHFMTLDHGDVAVKLSTLREEVVHLPTLNLKQIDVNLESKGNASNYAVILENLKKLESSPTPPEEQKKFIINKVVIQDVKVHANLLPLAGDAAVMHFPIAEIVLEDVGSETSGGMVLSDLAGVIVKAVFAAIVDKGGELLPLDVLGDLQGRLGDLESLSSMGIDMATNAGKAVEDVMKQAEGTVGDATKAVEGAKGAVDEAKKGIEDAVKGVGDLIPKKK